MRISLCLDYISQNLFFSFPTLLLCIVAKCVPPYIFYRFFVSFVGYIFVRYRDCYSSDSCSLNQILH